MTRIAAKPPLLVGEEQPLVDKREQNDDSALVDLYYAEQSFFSDIVRLCLEEKKIRWASHPVDIYIKQEHLSAWFLENISPNGTVPVLSWRSSSDDLEAASNSSNSNLNWEVDSRAIIHFIDRMTSVDEDGNEIRLTPLHEQQKDLMEKYIDYGYTFDVEGFMLGYFLQTGWLAKIFGESDAHRRVNALANVKRERSDLGKVCDQKIARNVIRYRRCFGDPTTTANEAMASLCSILGRLEEHLDRYGGPYICGEDFTLADVVIVVVLARGQWVKMGRDVISCFPLVMDYYSTVSSRPAFRKSGITDRFSPPAVVVQELQKKAIQGILAVIAVVIVIAAVLWVFRRVIRQFS